MNKPFRLKDGTMGTEAEAVGEAIRALEHQKLELDDQIAQLRRQLQAAESRP